MNSYSNFSRTDKNISLNEKICRWGHEYFRKKIQDISLKKFGRIVTCPNCKTWDYLMINDPLWICSQESPHDYMTCGQCGHLSSWFDHGIIRQYLPEHAPSDKDMNKMNKLIERHKKEASNE